MSTLQLSCPICDSRLQLPVGAAGQMARCPACDATFYVADESLGSASPPVVATIDPDSESNSLAAPLKSESLEPPLANPYQPASHCEPIAVLDDVEIMSRSIEEVVSRTWKIFRARYGQLILAFFLAALIGGTALLAMCAMLYTIEQWAEEIVFNLVVLVCLVFGGLLASYLAVGLARNAIAVARNDPSPLRELLPPPQLVIRFIVSGAVFGIVIAVAVGSLSAMLWMVARPFGGDGLALILLVVSALGGTALSVVSAWLLWPWFFLVSDGKTTALGAIRFAGTLTLHNKQTSVLLVVVAFVLATTGASAFNLGLLITQPFTHLLFAVAFLQMTNQAFDTGEVDQGQFPQD